MRVLSAIPSHFLTDWDLLSLLDLQLLPCWFPPTYKICSSTSFLSPVTLKLLLPSPICLLSQLNFLKVCQLYYLYFLTFSLLNPPQFGFYDFYHSTRILVIITSVISWFVCLQFICWGPHSPVPRLWPYLEVGSLHK